jgi:hypothetical protein
MGKLTDGAHACVTFCHRVFAKSYRVFLERVALKLFYQPETAEVGCFSPGLTDR